MILPRPPPPSRPPSAPNQRRVGVQPTARIEDVLGSISSRSIHSEVRQRNSQARLGSSLRCLATLKAGAYPRWASALLVVSISDGEEIGGQVLPIIVGEASAECPGGGANGRLRGIRSLRESSPAECHWPFLAAAESLGAAARWPRSVRRVTGGPDLRLVYVNCPVALLMQRSLARDRLEMASPDAP